MKFTVSLKRNSDFRRLYAKGKSAASSRLVLYCRRREGERSRLGITVSTRIGKAVVRNRVRRRIREIYRTNEQKLLPGTDLVVVARSRAVSSTYWELEADFLRLAEKLGLLA